MVLSLLKSWKRVANLEAYWRNFFHNQLIFVYSRINKKQNVLTKRAILGSRNVQTAVQSNSVEGYSSLKIIRSSIIDVL